MFSTREIVLRLTFRPWKTLSRSAHNGVRVRFAPSPTGYLHLGGLRTALYNFLYARSQNGKFLLRIEDTDQTRLVPGAANALVEDLLWAGITIDEGPGFGGKFGPYVQSERRAIYIDAVKLLLDNGTAYRCFCTERRLELIRKEALRTRQVPKYDNKCRHLKPQQTASLLENGTPFCIRFKLTDYMLPLNDIIYGPVHHNVSDNEGDPVIMKTDDFPTYHFANVVDDHMMDISHVFRGVEWQISTTKHLLLYKAFGWKPPQFGHLPLLVNPDGTKLSKRQGDISIKSFRDSGYFPEALVNYVVSAGGGFTRERHVKPQLLTLDKLALQFDIEKVNSHPSRLNPELLNDFNRFQIVKLVEDPDTAKQLIRYVQDLVQSAYPNEQNLDIGETHVHNVLRWATDRLTFIQDLVSAKLSFLWIKPTEFNAMGISADKLLRLMKMLEGLQFTKDNANQALKEFAQQENLKYALLMKVIRSALSGLKEGPGVVEMMDILGKEVVLQRLKDNLDNQQMLNTNRKTKDEIS